MFDPTRRVLLQALCFSLCAHLLGLLFLHPMFDGRPRQAFDAVRAETLHGILRAPTAAPVPNGTGTPAKGPRALVSPVPRLQSGPTVRGSRQTAVLSGEKPEAAVFIAPSVPPVLPSAPAERVPPPAEDLYAYRLSLALAARSFRDYPPEARARGEFGQTVVGIEMIAGRSRVDLAESSGHAALDAAALAMIRQAAMLAPLPQALQGLDFQLRLPVLFSLDDASPVQ